MENMKDIVQRKREAGFTIIEVVIVLAIAGMIFLIVFLAVPQLQRSQRDNARRQEMGRIATGIVEYASNNDGVLPSDDAAVASQVIGSYVDSVSIDVNGNIDEDQADYTDNGDCDGNGGSRAFNIRTLLESGDELCVDG